MWARVLVGWWMSFRDRWRPVFATAAVALLLSVVPCIVRASDGLTVEKVNPDDARAFDNVPVNSCRLGIQGVALAAEVSGVGSMTPLLTARLKVCAAWPACGTCVRMYEGDCRYVFPTYVMVYGVQDPAGPGKICACKALACSLPWDPGGWNKSCMQDLGCFDKPLLRDAGPFCNVLPGRKRSAKVRFVPLEFSKQSFWVPGFVAIVESWEQDRASSKVLHRKVRKHIINPGKRGDFEGIIGQKKDEYIWHTKGWKDDKESQEWAISEQEKSYSFSDNETKHYLKARREQDTVCARYYGTDPEMSTELFEECLPIPPMEPPRIYQVYSLKDSVGRGYYNRDKHIEDHCKSSAASRTEYLISSDESDKYRVQFIRGKDTVMRLSLSSGREGESGRAFVQRLKKSTSGDKWIAVDETGGPWAIHEEWIEEQSSEWYKKHITSNLDKRTRSSDSDVCERELRECVKFGGRDMCANVADPTKEFKNGSVPSVFQLSRSGTNGQQKWNTETSYYKHPVGAFWGYSSLDFMQQKITEIAKDYGGNANKVEFVGVAVDKNRELGGACGKVGDSSYDHKCEYYVVKTGKPKVMCITGIGSGTEISDYEVTSTIDGGISRTWLRKQPKMLRRYVLAGGDDGARRVLCDDKYSINLQLLSQPVLDNIVVKDGRFVVPQKLSGGASSGGKNNGDPCVRADSNTVYYYESGRFSTEPGSLAGCVDPSTQYYAPGRKVEGCTYEYVSMDDYRPVSLGGRVGGSAGYHFPAGVSTGDNIEKEGATVKLRPLSVYDRGLCIDNFARSWYEPEYKITNGHTQTVNKEYVVLKFEASNGDRTAGTASTQNGKWCQFYKIEAWGGGEAAAITEMGMHRSGRPGQYVVGILRNPDQNSKYSCSALASYNREQRGSTKISDLEFSIKVDIGEGGESQQPKKTESNKQPPVGYVRTEVQGSYGGGTGAGGDTVVKFCTKKKNSTGNQNGAQTQSNTQNTEQCHEIMRAVGGGSTHPGVLNVKAIKDLMVSYRTIIGDVLAGDDRAARLLLEGRAMFTKFPLEMNFPLTREKERILKVKEYFEGRSLPRSLCKRRLRYSKWRENDVFVPGMGGCWGDDGDNAPGLGESGAVMITCEQWDTVGPQELGFADKMRPERALAPGRTTGEARPGESGSAVETDKTSGGGAGSRATARRPTTTPKSKAAESTVRELKVEQPKPAAPEPEPQWPAKKKYLYCPWYAWWTIGGGHYSCMGGLREYEEVFNSEADYEYFLARQYKVREMYGCDDKRCAHFEQGYTNNRHASGGHLWDRIDKLDRKYKRGVHSQPKK
ncbi:hypothetical protein BKM88_04030 [Anaplasma marginale]|nr:hypothetical protein BKM88_04030 [Anaplasma marginale]